MGVFIIFLTTVGVLTTLLYGIYLIFKDTVFIGKFRNVYELLQMLLVLKQHSKRNNQIWSYVDDFEEMVDNKPDVIQFIFTENDQYISRQSLENRANQIANWANSSEINLKQKDTVAFMMNNHPDFVAFWLGISKVGCSTALLNTNNIGKAFIHSVNVAVENSKTKILVLDSEIALPLENELKELELNGIKIYTYNNLSKMIDTYSIKRPDKQLRNQILERDPFLYIFTSGTTGLPKASKITHTRFFLSSMPISTFCYLKPGDRLYTCLPLYHSAAGMLGIGGVLRSGATMVIR